MNTVSVDLGTVALLAIVVWLDGWRRWSDDTLLVMRSGSGPWTVRAPFARGGPFALVAQWAPITMPVLLTSPPDGARPHVAPWARDFGLARARAGRRLRRVGPVAALLRALGVGLTVWIIVGIPVATARFGAPGLIQGVAGAFLLSIAMTFGATISLSALGVPCRRAFRTTAQLLSPFTAPRAAEIVITTAVGARYSLGPVAALLGDEAFQAWIRPWAYDALAATPREVETDHAMAGIIGQLPRPLLERATASAPRDVLGDERAHYCPRCTRTYRESVATCGHCGDIALVTVRGPETAVGAN